MQPGQQASRLRGQTIGCEVLGRNRFPVQAGHALAEHRAQLGHELDRGIGRVRIRIQQLLQILLDQLHAFGFVADRCQSQRALDGMDGADQVGPDVRRPAPGVAVLDPLVNRLEVIADLTDHQLDQCLVQTFQFGQFGHCTDRTNPLGDGVDRGRVQFRRLSDLRCAQARQRSNCLADEFDHLIGRILPVDGLVEHLLDVPRKLADPHRAGHPARTLQGMEGPADIGEHDRVGRLGTPAREAVLQRRQFLVELLEEDRHQVEVVIIQR